MLKADPWLTAWRLVRPESGCWQARIRAGACLPPSGSGFSGFTQDPDATDRSLAPDCPNPNPNPNPSPNPNPNSPASSGALIRMLAGSDRARGCLRPSGSGFSGFKRNPDSTDQSLPPDCLVIGFLPAMDFSTTHISKTVSDREKRRTFYESY